MDYESRIFGKQNLDEVAFREIVGADFDTTLSVGKRHLEERGNKTSGRDVVSGKEHRFCYECLDCIECTCEIVGRLNSGRSCAKGTKRLGKSRATEVHGIA